MKKIIYGTCLVFVIAGLIIMILASSLDTTPEEYTNRFIVVEKLTDSYSILADTQTQVCYIAYHDGYHSGMSVMVNTDGTPILYEGVLPR